MEAIFFEVFIDSLVELFGHNGWAVEDPKVVVVGRADNCIAVGLIQSDDPVISLSGERWHLNFEFGVAVRWVFGIRESLAVAIMLNSLLVATSIINLDGAISVHWKVLESFLAALLKPGRNGCDFIPKSHVALKIHMRYSFRRVSLEVVFSEGERFEVLGVDWGVKADEKSQQECQYYLLHFFW